MSDPELDAVIHPGYGGSISVLDLRPQGFNLAGALTRRPEAYHAHFAEAKESKAEGGEVKSIHDVVVFKEKNLEKYLIYDWYERGLFQDPPAAPPGRPARIRAGRLSRMGRFHKPAVRAWAMWDKREQGVLPSAARRQYLGPGRALALDHREKLHPGAGGRVLGRPMRSRP